MRLIKLVGFLDGIGGKNGILTQIRRFCLQNKRPISIAYRQAGTIIASAIHPVTKSTDFYCRSGLKRSKNTFPRQSVLGH
ncbi:MAG TPA: hypothetical protein DEQ66_02165 [Prevotella sp.]|nr:hypothetical protein [Prevotella sp.]